MRKCPLGYWIGAMLRLIRAENKFYRRNPDGLSRMALENHTRDSLLEVSTLTWLSWMVKTRQCPGGCPWGAGRN